VTAAACLAPLLRSSKSETNAPALQAASSVRLFAYLQGIDNAEIIETVHTPDSPTIPVSAQLLH
jgi:hypothetical protein